MRTQLSISLCFDKPIICAEEFFLFLYWLFVRPIDVKVSFTDSFFCTFDKSALRFFSWQKQQQGLWQLHSCWRWSVSVKSGLPTFVNSSRTYGSCLSLHSLVLPKTQSSLSSSPPPASSPLFSTQPPPKPLVRPAHPGQVRDVTL